MNFANVYENNKIFYKKMTKHLRKLNKYIITSIFKLIFILFFKQIFTYYEMLVMTYLK